MFKDIFEYKDNIRMGYKELSKIYNGDKKRKLIGYARLYLIGNEENWKRIIVNKILMGENNTEKLFYKYRDIIPLEVKNQEELGLILEEIMEIMYVESMNKYKEIIEER